MTELNDKPITELNVESIVQTISTIFKDDEYIFDVFILMKGEPKQLKNFVLYEGPQKDRKNPEVNFKLKLQNTIADVIQKKYAQNEENNKYDNLENIADNQNKFYIIPQINGFQPFEILNTVIKKDDDDKDNIENYRIDDITSAEGIFFRYERDDKVLWAFQYFWPTSIPNRKGIGFHIIPQDDVFVELTKPILIITKKVDLLVIENNIITNDIDLLQTHYKFQDYIRSSAANVISEVSKLSIVSNIDKINDYISQIKLTHAKKVLRLKNSKVLTKSKEDLYKKITTLPRWRGKFELNETDHTIILKTNAHVESLIDLLDERYTRSDVTNEEYDTSAKKWIGPVTQKT